MSASSAMSVPTISPGEMQLLLSRAGLMLNPGQVADLVLAWRQVAGLIAAIPHDRPLVDDMALSFRLPPPTRPPPPMPAAKPRAKAKAKARAKARPKAKSPKLRAAKSAPRKGARRGR